VRFAVQNITGNSPLQKSAILTAYPILFTPAELTDIQTLSFNNQLTSLNGVGQRFHPV
jgi:hypothetical protein